MTRADVVIAGAGSAGCVLAARLTEDAERSVVLLEAGPDYSAVTDLPPEIRSGLRPVFTHDWGYRTEPGPAGRELDANRARLVGGCSATNAAIALRGRTADYDGWASLGCQGWAFGDVLPFFRKVEGDLDFGDRWHGQEGPVPIRRFAPDELTPMHRSFLQACANAGFPVVDDLNAPDAVGAASPPMNLVDGVRQSTALTYLARARGRPNLSVRGDATVDRVHIDGSRVAGVRLARSGEVIEAEHVILATGAYGSPAILWRSGIGPASDLSSVGIDPVLDRPAVGQNLIEHPLMPNVFVAKTPPQSGRPVCQAMLTAPSSTADGVFDLHVLPFFNPPEIQGDPALLVILASVMTPRSRGSVRLRSADPNDAPVIDLGLLTHPDDMPRLLEAVRIVRELARTEPLAGLLGDELMPGSAVTGAHELAAAVRDGIAVYHHPVGTCRMGRADDPAAVVDPHGRVHGMSGLSVIDASIMPSIPAANTNLPTMMIAERCAAWLRAEHE